MLRKSSLFLLTLALTLGFSLNTSTANINAATTSALAKTPGYSNPLITQKFGADPWAMVYNGRVYLYMSSDSLEYKNGQVADNDYSNIKTISVISSDDMVNWTDHGEIPVAGYSGAARWASNSWAPAVTHKIINGKEKFFLYFANNGGGIGVLTSDSPIGPWTDPIGRPLITGSTPGASGVPWLFDPAVLVDDDGTGYLYFGGGVPGGSSPSQSQTANPRSARVIKLSSDMTHTVGSAVTIDSPFMFEDSGIHKYNGKYYYSYCSNFSGNHPYGAPPAGDVAYMTSNSPMGPFNYQGVFLKNPGSFFGVGGNNHHAVFQFKNQWYVTYHAQTLGKAMGITKGYRSPMINKLSYSSNGSINNVTEDMQGVPQVANLNPYIRNEAETIGWNGGISTEKCSAPGSIVSSLNMDVTSINDGDWLAVSKADFGNGADSFKANIASTVGGKIEIHLDSVDGQAIGTLNVNPTGGEQQWKEMQCNVKKVSGVHNIFFKFTGSNNKNLFNIDYWQFGGGNTPTPVPTTKVDAPAMSVAAGTYSTAQKVALSSATSDAAIYYTTDGSDPTSSSTLYSGPITISKTTTLKAIAVKTGMTDSDVTSADYAISSSPEPQSPIEVSCSVAGNWGSGATINVTIKNNGTAPINGWNLSWTLPSGQTVTSMWNGSYVMGANNTITVSSMRYNAAIAPNSTQSFGFNMSYSGAFSAPTAYKLNGVDCTIK